MLIAEGAGKDKKMDDVEMKLDEAERSNQTRLMKVKDLMVEEQILKNRRREY